MSSNMPSRLAQDIEEILWTQNERRMLKYMLENDGMQYFRYFFKLREGEKLLLNWHHYVIQYVLDAVMDLKINRLIVNLAPRYTKTEQIVINFISRALALHPRSKFIQTSYSNELVIENSSKIKDTILLPEYQDLWPMQIRVDKKGNKTWFNEYGGGLKTAPSKGQITGFGAGRMTPGVFTGAFITDDPIKPADAFSEPAVFGVNSRFNNTNKSRLATPQIPYILLMQRLHPNDLCGFLLRGGSGDKWFHLVIPTDLTEKALNAPYPQEYTHGIPININGVLNALHTGKEYDFFHNA